jgi:hypothetical protein
MSSYLRDTALDGAKTDLADQASSLKKQRAEIQNQATRLAGDQAAFQRAKENLRELVSR